MSWVYVGNLTITAGVTGNEKYKEQTNLQLADIQFYNTTTKASRRVRAS